MKTEAEVREYLAGLEQELERLHTKDTIPTDDMDPKSVQILDHLRARHSHKLRYAIHTIKWVLGET